LGFPVFQQIDIDEATDSTGIIVRLFGVTQMRKLHTLETPVLHFTKQEGYSVLMNVTHFDPYLYVPCPCGFTSNDLEPFKNHLNVRTCNFLPIPTLKYLCRKFQGVIMLYEQNSLRNKVFGVIRGIRP
jgi:hypothetical protein